jgi:vitamin B12 transporter
MCRIAGYAISLSIVLASGAARGADDEPALLDEISVTATRVADGIPVGLLGGSVTVIGPQAMRDRQVRVVSDVLRDVPGVAVSRLGAVAGQTQVRIRGSEANHVLVLIDGVKASDPFYDEFDFGTLIADDIARVEVLRGQQSSLYGSDAIGGVISYSTLSGREAPGFSARVEGGTYQSLDTAVRYGGVAGVMDYAVSGGWQRTDGYRVARSGSRSIGAENAAVAGKFDFDVSDALRIRTMLRANRTEADSPGEGYSPGTPDFGAVDGVGGFTSRTFIGSVRAEYDAMDGNWKSALSMQRVDAKRDGRNVFSAFGDKGGRTLGSFASTLRFGAREALQQLFTVAVDYEVTASRNTEGGTGNRDATNQGTVLEYNLRAGQSLGFGMALRHDESNRFADVTTFRTQGSYLFDGGTRLRAAAGSGVKNPSLTELYGYYLGTYVGNANLKPEKSSGWEAGIDQQLLEGRVVLGATYFRSKLENEIYSVFGGPPGFITTPANRGTLSKQRGFELAVNGKVSASWNVAAAWTHLDARENGVAEVRRPPDTGSLNVGWSSPARTFGANLTVRYNGAMTDSNFYEFNAPDVSMDAFTLLNLGLDWNFTGNVQFYGRVENVLDEDYEEVFTYRASGRAGYAGVRLRF